MFFNNSPVVSIPSQKHLDVHLDEKLNFNEHMKEKIVKACQGISVIKELQNKLFTNALLTIYKSFKRPHLDCVDVVYDEPNNESFNGKLEKIQCNAASAITGAIKCTSRKKLYKELGLESLKCRRWLRRLIS